MARAPVMALIMPSAPGLTQGHMTQCVFAATQHFQDSRRPAHLPANWVRNRDNSHFDREFAR
ncbi:hypothetical protein RAN3_2572 [plant metagenome]|uniref:Uncharacterized protein n=1 Tax=plant metagenome TaxID=1297885 RepID=A0A484U3R1_9ZZZZ